MHYHKKVLPNGLRIITVPMKDHPTVTVMVLVEAGSKYETKKQNGLSHFLEHMCFKGTKTRPSALHITRELDGIGAHYNAFTAQEFTGYYAKSDFKHINKTLDVVSDIYLNSTLPESEINKEKGVIVEEINMYEDLPQRKVQDVFMNLLYGDTPAGWDIAGTRENVRAFTREDFVNYRSKNYVASATIVVVAGNFDEDKTIADIEKKFKDASDKKKDSKQPVKEKQENSAVKIAFKETDQAHFVLGVRTFDVHSKKNPILRVLATILGGGMSSRLFQKIRDEMGAGYYIGTTNESFTDHGFLEVAGGVDQKRLAEVITAVIGEFKRLKTEKVVADELRKAKDYITGNMYLSLETSDALADIYGYQEVMRKDINGPDEICKLIEKVSAEDINNLASQIFKTEALNLAVIGRFKEDSEFLPLLVV